MYIHSLFFFLPQFIYFNNLAKKNKEGTKSEFWFNHI